MATLVDVVRVLEDLYPLNLAESWDNPGLIVGNPTDKVNKIVCLSDPTLEAVEESCKMGADLIVSHHPLFFRSVHEVSGLSVRGKIVQTLIENHCGLWVGHTNADAAFRGVAAAAASAFGLKDLHPLVPASNNDTSLGLGRVGVLEQKITLKEFAMRVFNALPTTKLGVQVCGDINAIVSKIAVLPGSGDSLFDEVRACGADVYVTSDLRHHPATDAYEQAIYESQLANSNIIKPMLINTPHSAIESLWFKYAVQDIHDSIYKNFGELLDVSWIGRAFDPWNYVIN
ncbi:Nif3-like dinuclear metal center hexameric protein [Gardnerella vaginalis]|uniref:Nif3-like dinuclear metal center hexameric protein n=1 Tax=Gardnerella vaginalis TaxID=2702 RepID=UPI000353B899|nr:Nif3-like dinuclear metal center hexameric protein [Gardnerella vaginalis]EPI55865.1 dinuclear metal center protein, YbgI family [Gardnerella vaginalis JCP7275]